MRHRRSLTLAAPAAGGAPGVSRVTPGHTPVEVSAVPVVTCLKEQQLHPPCASQHRPFKKERGVRWLVCVSGWFLWENKASQRPKRVESPAQPPVPGQRDPEPWQCLEVRGQVPGPGGGKEGATGACGTPTDDSGVCVTRPIEAVPSHPVHRSQGWKARSPAAQGEAVGSAGQPQSRCNSDTPVTRGCPRARGNVTHNPNSKHRTRLGPAAHKRSGDSKPRGRRRDSTGAEHAAWNPRT